MWVKFEELIFEISFVLKDSLLIFDEKVSPPTVPLLNFFVIEDEKLRIVRKSIQSKEVPTPPLNKWEVCLITEIISAFQPNPIKVV